jgi:hypothetical protein
MADPIGSDTTNDLKPRKVQASDEQSEPCFPNDQEDASSMWQQLSNYLPETDLIFDSSAEYARMFMREMFTFQSKMTT